MGRSRPGRASHEAFAALLGPYILLYYTNHPCAVGRGTSSHASESSVLLYPLRPNRRERCHLACDCAASHTQGFWCRALLSIANVAIVYRLFTWQHTRALRMRAARPSATRRAQNMERCAQRVGCFLSYGTPPHRPWHFLSPFLLLYDISAHRLGALRSPSFSGLRMRTYGQKIWPCSSASLVSPWQLCFATRLGRKHHDQP